MKFWMFSCNQRKIKQLSTPFVFPCSPVQRCCEMLTSARKNQDFVVVVILVSFVCFFFIIQRCCVCEASSTLALVTVAGIICFLPVWNSPEELSQFAAGRCSCIALCCSGPPVMAEHTPHLLSFLTLYLVCVALICALIPASGVLLLEYLICSDF